jgi:3-hydroxybutyryl-CoA dehydrogenase
MTKIIVCVCGAGTMGSGIAQAAAQAGFYTLLYEPVSQVLGNAKNRIENNLKWLVEKIRLMKVKKKPFCNVFSF